MIRAQYRKDGNIHALTVTGHAEYSSHGDDIVCAGASSIIYALLGWLENNSEDLEYSDADVHSGNVHIECEGGERTAVAFEMMAIGLMQLQDAYASHVEITVVGLAD